MLTSSSVSHVRLLADPETLNWISIIDEAYWLVGDRRSALILCGYSKISLDAVEFKSAREACLGRVYVYEEQSEPICRVSFIDWRGAPARDDAHLSPMAEDLHFATWTLGMHPDGWIDVSSILHVEGANRVTLNLYLPPSEIIPDAEKSVDLMVDGHRFHTARISRGTINTIILPLDALAAGGKAVDIEAEYAEPLSGTNDARLLGFLVTGVSLERVDTVISEA